MSKLKSIRLDQALGASMKIKKIVVSRVDPDTMLTAFLVAGTQVFSLPIEVVRGSASGQDLSDSQVLCIECGGSGQVWLMNFDHHGGGTEMRPACLQAYQHMETFGAGWRKLLWPIVEYVGEFDAGRKSRHERSDGPTFAWLLAGLLLCNEDPIEQLRAGFRLFDSIVRHEIDPYRSMNVLIENYLEFENWLTAKKNHESYASEVAKQVKWFEVNGFVIAAINSSWFGTPGLMEGLRNSKGRAPHITISFDPVFDAKVNHPLENRVVKYCNVVPLFEQLGVKPEFVQNGFAKFTITGGERLDELCKQLESADSVKGWGGPNHMTIIGSNRTESSSLSLEAVIQIVKSYCQSNRVWVTTHADNSSRKTVVPFQLRRVA